MEVRRVRRADIPDLVELGEELAKESPEFRYLTYSREQAAEFVEYCTEEFGSDNYVGYLIQDGAEVVGVLLAYASQTPFFVEYDTCDAVLFIKPSHRGKCGAALAKMVLKYKQWSYQFNGRTLLGVATGIESESALKTFDRLGFKVSGYLLRCE